MPGRLFPAAKEVLVLEQLFCPREVRRIRRCWLAADIERYLESLRQQRFNEHLIRDRVPPLVRFARFTTERGVQSREQLPDHVDAFVADEGRRCSVRTRDERGLRATTIRAHGHHLRLLEAFMREERLGLGDLTPANLTAFVVARSRRVGLADVGACTGVLRVFLRYARREHLIDRDLASAVEHPKSYTLATLPRSIGREEVARFLAIIDRTSKVGGRDYVGHRQPHTTQIYSKVSVEKLREVALARGEAAL